MPIAAKVKPVCSKCLSDDVLSDAYAMWDEDAQEWILQNTFDKGSYCGPCEGETKLIWVEIKSPNETHR